MSDYRHDRRIKLMQDVFACSFSDQTLANCLADSQQASESNVEDATTLSQILQALEGLDLAIQQAAPERPLADINKVDLAILRTIYFESLHHKTPKRVLIDEAIELAKAFGSDSSAKFVNGVLAKLLLAESEKVR